MNPTPPKTKPQSASRARSGLSPVADVAAATIAPQLHHLPSGALVHVAAYFRTLSEEMRLRILRLLSQGEMSVGDIAEALQSSNANVSRHLAQMALHGLVAREGRGTAVYYRIADPSVFELCELVCGSIAKRFEASEAHRVAFSASRPRR